MSQVGIGRVKLSDGTELKLQIMIVDVKDAGFSPLGGVNFAVNAVGGIATSRVPEELRKAVEGRPLAVQVPEDGWELVDIVEFEPAVVETVAEAKGGKFVVRVEAEPVMAARNLRYRSMDGGPYYWLSWVYKTRWRPEGA
ncbi:MAG: hypothetical protein ACP5UD_07610 [Conexivisphaera sp.]